MKERRYHDIYPPLIEKCRVWSESKVIFQNLQGMLSAVNH